MKTMICLLLAAGGCAAAHAQKVSSDKVPLQVQIALTSKYPSAGKVQWEVESKLYEAEFTLNKEKMAAVFEENGAWVKTETEINRMDLPATVRMSIEVNFPGYRLDGACRIQHAKWGSGYETGLEKGDEELEVFFSQTGEILNKVVEKEAGVEDKD